MGRIKRKGNSLLTLAQFSEDGITKFLKDFDNAEDKKLFMEDIGDFYRLKKHLLSTVLQNVSKIGDE